MNSLERIGIGQTVQNFSEKHREIIENMISDKSAAELASSNFKKAALPVLGYAKEIGNTLTAEGVSKEILDLYEAEISELLKHPFKIQ